MAIGAGVKTANAVGRMGKLARVADHMKRNGLDYAFIGFESRSRMKEGDSLPVAVGKAVLTDAAFSLLPGGIYGAIALGVISATPHVLNALDGARQSLNAKKSQFGGNFEHTPAQVSMIQTGMTNMQNARMHATRQMANHARGAQRVY